MRARWLKPEFFRDRKIAALGTAAALVYEALWCMSDDGGVAKGAAEEIKGEMLVWWVELDVPAVRTALQNLEAAKRITGYTIGEDQYWILHTLLKHQGKIHNPSKFRHPRKTVAEDSYSPIGDEAKEGVGTRHLDTSIPDTPEIPETPETPKHPDTSASSVGELSRLLITRLNQGMQDNPVLRGMFTPVVYGHSYSLTAAEDISQAGVPVEFASAKVYELAKAYKPQGRNRQIKTLGYCTDAVISSWEKHRELESASSTSRPAGSTTKKNGNGHPPTGDRTARNVGTLTDWLAGKEQAEIVDVEVVEDGQQ